MNPKDAEDLLAGLACPNCHATGRSGKITYTEFLNHPPEVTCTCGERGTPAYFTPVEQPKRKLIERTLDVDWRHGDKGHVKALAAAMELLARAADEEELDLDWPSLQVRSAGDHQLMRTTFVVVITATPRRHVRPASPVLDGEKVPW